MKISFFYKVILFFCTAILGMSLTGIAQVVLPTYPDSIFTTYYHQRYSLFKSLPNAGALLPNDGAYLLDWNRDIIFLGNSINDGSEWAELFKDIRIKNRGISGDITTGIIHRLKEVTNRKPAKVFLMIGINDLGRGVSPDSVVKNILLINDYILQESPSTKVFIESILPVNASFGKFAGQVSKGVQVLRSNELLKAVESKHRFEYIDLHSNFVDAQGLLDAKYTNDGLHLTGAGYQHWRHLIYPKVFGLTAKPALIPMPTEVNWKDGYYYLQEGKTLNEQVTIVLASPNQKNSKPELKGSVGEKNVSFSTNEAYELSVSPTQIIIKAATEHGVFNAMQTLQQLARNGQTIDAVEINDSPAFAWRGYMIDVGRNYLSMNLLKQQIDIMAKYKLNVFHFHATEDIAWRIAIKQYPQLTAPEHMLRNKGMYYTEAEIKELIAYCKARNILFMPEIDMPGHSAAFKRAMKVDMQSDSGIVYVKNILKEFCTTYDVPFIHIGADEVKITNSNFIPEITKYIQSFGKKVIGWQPGGNFLDSTIRQLWMDDLGKITNDKQVQYIDSRHLYLNHMDPLEAVTTIFNRQLANRNSGDNNALGAIICTWHDRAVATQDDVLKMNPVYPAMLAFAERSWRGGGQPRWIANISDGDVKGFKEFEQRLLNHQQQTFNSTDASGIKYSFPYQPQSSLEWKFYGPFEKDADAKENFFNANTRAKYFFKTVTGGTVVLRHWWAPLIKGDIDSIKPNQVWYAITQIWSEENTIKPFWVGFNNLSRSPATDSPPAFAWNEHHASVRVNGGIVPPPIWNRAGQKGNSEIPLIDEGYEYRQPTMIELKKGWNEVRIKIPIGKLSGKDWQNPAKYMFTFVPVVR
jgi:lysophospholipase L1-like esterase